MQAPRTRLRPFARSEDGSATVQFALLLPLFLGLFLATFELGMLLTRQMMLDRAVDLAVRQVRIGAFQDVAPGDMHEAIMAAICANNIVMRHCERDLLLWAERIDPRAYAAPSDLAVCRDRKDRNKPVDALDAGAPNDLMYVRACALFDPFFPTIGLGRALDRQSGDAYAIFSASAYAVEPD